MDTCRSLVVQLTVACGLAALIVAGCDPTVDVLNPSDQYRYSLFGVLDVAADTQVIRVEPLGDTTQLGSPPNIDVSVLLENLETGTRTPLSDSFETVGGIDSVHNFRTTRPIQPATSYRVVVQKDEEQVTTATTTTPARPPTLLHQPDSSSDRPFRLPCELNINGEPSESQNTFSLRVRDVSGQIAAVKVAYPLVQPKGDRVFDHLQDAKLVQEQDYFRVSVFYGRDLFSLNQQGIGCIARSQFRQPYARAVVSAGGPNWPDWANASLDELARPDTFSNVKGGHGFVGGIYSDTLRIPVEERNN